MDDTVEKDSVVLLLEEVFRPNKTATPTEYENQNDQYRQQNYCCENGASVQNRVWSIISQWLEPYVDWLALFNVKYLQEDVTQIEDLKGYDLCQLFEKDFGMRDQVDLNEHNVDDYLKIF